MILESIAAYLHSRIFVPASTRDIAFGSPTLGTVGSASSNQHPAWLLDSAGTEVVAGLCVVPPDWVTSDVRALMVNLTTSTRNYITQLAYKAPRVG